MTQISPSYKGSKTGRRLRLCCALTLAAAAPTAVFAQVTRTDVLECAVQDGSRFLLESRYKWRVVPIPGYPSREYDRGNWRVSYRDRSGRISIVPASLKFSNRTTRHLIDTCSHFGMWNNTPLAPYSYLKTDGTWYQSENFPWDQLDVNPLGEPGSPRLERASQLAAAGIRAAAFLFAYIAPYKDKLIYEQPLFDTNMGYIFAKPVFAVFQAESSDGGVSWTNAGMTRTPRIFEVGKGRDAQRIRAIPVVLNGKKVFLERQELELQG